MYLNMHSNIDLYAYAHENYPEILHLHVMTHRYCQCFNVEFITYALDAGFACFT
jgi:hypothetical protein